MAGYPGTPLPKKLGIKAGHKVCLLNAPGTFERSLAGLIGMSDDIRITHDLRLPPLDIVVLFIDRLSDLEVRFADIVSRLRSTARLWVAWRTRRSIDVTEDVVRRVALATGMVTLGKACSIDDCWSGLRLVLRGEHRDAIGYRPPIAEPAVGLVRIAAIEPPSLSRRTRRSTAAARMAHRTPQASSGPGSSMRRARARSTR